MSTVVEREPPGLPGLTFIERLGTGGYAEVFLYEQSNTRLRVAVKVLFPEQVSERSLQQFEAEAKAMAELADHPYIVQVFQAGVTPDGRPYLVMKYYPNRNLAVRAKSERISVPEVLRIGVQISCAVETAHRAGILHRDIKPANILTSHYGQPGLTDFGIATRSSGGAEEESEGLSIPWSAPEVVFATSSGDRTSDVYSLGATLWHLLAGRSPFEVPGGDNSQPALMRRIRESPVPKTGRPDVPPSLERVVAQAMAKRPSDRPQTALDLARSLQAVETEQRWAPTPLVIIEDDATVVGDPAGGAGGGEGTEGEATRLRRPQAVIAQPPASGRVPPTPLANEVGDPATIQRPAPVRGAQLSAVPRGGSPGPTGSPEPAEEPSTLRRPATVPTPAPDDPDRTGSDPGPRRSKLWMLAAATAAVAVAAVGTAVALSGGGAKAAPRTTVTQPPPTLALVVPNSPVVTGNRTDPAHVTFTWTEADAGAGYRYYYQEAGSPPQAVEGNSVTVPAAAGQKVCLTVQVTADDGTESASSQLTCAG